MVGPRLSGARKIFRPSRILAVVMAGAGLLWGAVLLYLLKSDGVPAKTMLSAIFFVLFFAVSLTYYARTRIIIDAVGITYRGILKTQYLRFTDIRNLDVLPGLITVYAVRGNRGLVHFTSFFSDHRDLVALLVERAGLAPNRA
jgi:hypothetical protein